MGQPQARDRLRRRPDGRLLAGVCGGLADHLRLDPVVVRLAFVLLSLSGGLGVAAYVALWVLVPVGEQPAHPRRTRDFAQLVAYGALTLGLSMLVLYTGGLSALALWPVVAAAIGAALMWQQADPARRERWAAFTATSVRETWLRTLIGVALVVAGTMGFLISRGQLSEARRGIAATVVILVGFAVVLAPWLIRLVRELDRERRERIRSQERAEIAAHLHDSVLHTLTLIQRNADDPREVRRLARAQERALRTWLYRPRPDDTATLSVAVERLAAEVEEAHGVRFEVVCVGDCPIDERLGAALQAAREAMVNAAKYSGAPSVAVYAEVEPEQVTIFVRDRGVGFTLSQVPPDRMGVRQSIIGRMERNGGLAVIRTAPGEGTEVELQVKRDG